MYFGYLPMIPIGKLADYDIEVPVVRTVTGNEIKYVGAVELQIKLDYETSGIHRSVPALVLVMDESVPTRPTEGEHYCLIGMNVIETCSIYRKRPRGEWCEMDPVYTNLLKVAEIEDQQDGRLGTVRLADSLTLEAGEEKTIKCVFRSKVTGVRATVLTECNHSLAKFVPVLQDVNLRTLSRVTIPIKNTRDTKLTLGRGVVVGVAYISESPFTLQRRDIQCLAEMAQLQVEEHTETEEFLQSAGGTGLRETEDLDLTPDMRQLWEHVETQRQHLEDGQYLDLLSVLLDNSKVFSKSEYDIGKVEGVKHAFNLIDDVPFKVRNRNVPPRMFVAAKEHINQLLQKGIIRHSTSPYSSAPLFIQKPDGRVRMVTDLRHLNAKTVRDNYALPRIDDILPHLAGNRYFTKMDIRSGYYNIEIEERDKEKTAFSTPFGLFEYNRMVQGAKTSAATFQRCMENVLKPLLYEGCIAFLDDVIIYSKTVEEHLEILDQALKLMQKAGLKIHPGKCTILAKEILYLGHTITEHGIQANPEKTACLTDWPQIRTVKDLMSFLGFCGYFRRHIPHFSGIAKPLVALTQGVKYKPKDPFGPPTKHPALERDITDEWSEECQKAREKLIQCLTNPPLLAFPNMTKTFILHVDACTTGLGAVLLQYGDDDKLHPVCYASRALKKSECNYPVYKLEFLALKWAVTEKFHMYLYGSPFKVYTDNNPLTYIHTTLKVDATSQRWLAALGDYDFTIHYKPGTTNVDADILSRLAKAKDISCDHISAFIEGKDPIIQYVDVSALEVECGAVRANINWTDVQNQDFEFKEVMRLVKMNEDVRPADFPRNYRRLFYQKHKMYFNESGILCKKADFEGQDYELIVLPHCALPLVLNALHNESGHFGIERTASLFRRRFYYPGYAQVISDYIGSCVPCVTKKSTKKKHGMLGEVSARRPFETLSMDFLSIENDKSGYGHVLIVTDVFTKYAYAFPTKNEKATTVAKLLVDKVFSVFGLPQKLLSDRGRNFESKVIEQLCKLLGIKKVFTCPYNPKSDSVCERFNRTLIGMLGTLSEQKRQDWHKYVPHLVGVYNSTQHSSTGFSPFELMFGRKSRLPVDQYLGTNPIETEYDDVGQYIEELRERMEFVHALAQQSQDHSHSMNKYRYDQKVSEEILEPGDWVFVRNVGVKGMHKLAPTYLPEVFQVLRCVDGNPRVYEIRNLTRPRRKNRILHVDMLLKVTGIEEEFNRTHLPGYAALDQEVSGEEIAELFRTGGTLPSPKLDRDPGLETKDQGRNLGRKARYGLRSATKVLQKVDDESSETDSDEDEELFLIRSVPQPQESQPLPEQVSQQDEDQASSQGDELVEPQEEGLVEDVEDREPHVMDPQVPALDTEPLVVEEVEVEEEVPAQLPQELLPKEASRGPASAAATRRAPKVKRDDYPRRDRKKTQHYGDPVTYAMDVHGFRKYLGPIIHV